MRVCLVSKEVAPFFGGGIGTYILQMSRALVREGHDVCLLTTAHEGLLEKASAALPGVRVRIADVDAGLAGAAKREAYALRYSLAVYEALARWHRETPFDLVEFAEYQAEGYHAIRAKRWLGEFEGAVLAVRLHSPTAELRTADGNFAVDRAFATVDAMELACCRECDLLIACSRFLLDRVNVRLGERAAREGGQLRHPSRERIIPLPFELPEAARDEQAPASAPAGDGPSAPTLLYFGRLQRLKGVETLVRAAVAMLREGAEVRFRLIGSDTPTAPGAGSMLAHLRGLIPAELAPMLSFEPAMAREALYAEIRRATAVCLPSLMENFPNAVLEAMSLGAPLVASDAGGIAEIVEDRSSGLLFPAGSVTALRAALERVLGQEQLRQRLSRHAVERARELCDPESVVREVIDCALRVKKEPEADAGRVLGVPLRPRGLPEIAPDAARFAGVVLPGEGAEPVVRTLGSLRAQSRPVDEVLLLCAPAEPAEDGDTGLGALRTSQGLVRAVEVEGEGLRAALAATARQTRAEWLLIVPAGVAVDASFAERAARGARRDPSVVLIGGIVVEESPTPGNGGDARCAAPLGPEPDLLPAFDTGPSMPWLLRRDAAAQIAEGVRQDEVMGEWDVLCAIAERGWRAAVLPSEAARVAACSAPRDAEDAFTRAHAAMLARHPALTLHPDYTMRLLASERDAARQSAAARSDEAATLRRRVRQLEAERSQAESPPSLRGA